MLVVNYNYAGYVGQAIPFSCSAKAKADRAGQVAFFTNVILRWQNGITSYGEAPR